MARSQRYDEPVSDEELEQMPERIREAFDEAWSLLEDEGVEEPEERQGRRDGDEV